MMGGLFSVAAGQKAGRRWCARAGETKQPLTQPSRCFLLYDSDARLYVHVNTALDITIELARALLLSLCFLSGGNQKQKGEPVGSPPSLSRARSLCSGRHQSAGTLIARIDDHPLVALTPAIAAAPIARGQRKAGPICQPTS